MPLIVDGNNVLGTSALGDSSGERRLAFAFQVQRLATREGRRIVVVFDGTPPSTVSISDVWFSGAGKAADRLILDFLAGQKNPKDWIVVTNDRSLGDRCRHLGARVERCGQFLARLAQGAEANKPGAEKPDPAQDIEYWKKVFGGEDDAK